MSPRLIPFLPAAGALAALLSACAGSSLLEKPEQGLQGAFLTYGHPASGPEDCAALGAWSRIDSCRRERDRLIEEPYRGTLEIRNLATRRSLRQPLDGEGRYRAVLEPGTYAVCVDGECSDPIEVRFGDFTTYGQRLPRPADPAAPAADSASAAAANADESKPDSLRVDATEKPPAP